MLQPGKSYKVKVELEPGKVGYGRATIVEKAGNRLFIQLKTSKEAHCHLPKGSRLWFVSESPTATMNGLWSTTVVGAKIFGGHSAMECGSLKFEPLVQRRKSQRVPFSCPVKLAGQELSYAVVSRNVSRSGIGIEAYSQNVDEFPVGEDVDIVLETKQGKTAINCKVIRTEYNWLSNRTIIGLQFVSMSQDAVELLEQFRSAVESKTEVGEQAGKLSTTFSGSLSTSRDNLKLTRSRANLRSPVEDDASPEEFDEDSED